MKNISRRIVSRGGRRQGIVLMIMLSLLALFTVMAVTFVVASGQFRRGVVAASRAEQTGDSFDILLQQAAMQVVRGSNHPHSVLGPHSLLEDMYGNSDAATGCVVMQQNMGISNPMIFNEIQSWVGGEPMLLKFSGISFGWDRLPGIAMADDDNNGVIDDVSERQNGTSDDRAFGSTPTHPYMVNVLGTTPGHVVDNVDNYYAGRVITFVSGPAAGQSCYIVRSKVYFASASQEQAETVFFVMPPSNGKRPSNFDRFVINGRPFSGGGFGYTPYEFDGSGNPQNMKPLTIKTTTPNGASLTIPNPRLRMLDQPYHSIIDASNASMQLSGKLPIVYTPNPVDPGYREYLDKYAPFVDADEDYDIADAQNMLLAARQLNRRTGRYEMVAPSLHRPDLINHIMQNGSISSYSAGKTANRRWVDIPPSIRRRIILRPDPVDHYDYTQENVVNPINSDGWTPGEPFIDTNMNGVWDPYVTSLNGPEQYTDSNGNGGYDVGDRAYFNNSFDALIGPWDVDNDNDGSPDSIWVDLGMPVTTDAQGRLVKPLFAIMVIDMDGRINANAHGSYANVQTVLPDLSRVSNAGPGTAVPVWNGARPRPAQTLNNVYQTNHFVSEERNMLGAYGYGTSVNTAMAYSYVRQQTIGSPLVQGEYAGLTTTQQQNVRWASAYQFDNPGIDATASLYTNMTITAMNGVITPRIEPAFGQGYGVADVNTNAIVWGQGMDGLPYLSGGSSLPASPTRVNDASRLFSSRYGESHLVRTSSTLFAHGGVRPQAGATQTYFPTNLSLNTTLTGFYPNLASSLNDDNIPAPPSGTGSVLGNSGRDFYGSRNVGDFGSPPDLNANGAVGLDLLGHPVYYNMGTADETIDEPYETNLNRRYFPRMIVGAPTTTGGFGYMADKDAPFTPADLERILRRDDVGSIALPRRLDSIVTDSKNDVLAQNLVTTESWDIPCPHVAPTPELAAALRDLGLPVSNPSIGDLMKARFYLANGTTIGSLASSQMATVAMRSYVSDAPYNRARLFSPDLGMGLRMNVNAPFGNALDDNNNNVVDEPIEGGNEYIQSPTGPLPFDGNRDGVASGIAEQPRQQFAKELYCLMMLLIDQNYVIPVPQMVSSLPNLAIATQPEFLGLSTGTPPVFAATLMQSVSVGLTAGESQNVMKAKRWMTARRIAQWAINAADFRDRDSIMSGFEFDVDPFADNDGGGTAIDVTNPGNTSTWDVDGDLTTDETAPGSSNATSGNWFRGVVWGCEYPDLLLTETMAYHDRRTQNTFDEDNSASLLATIPTGTNKFTHTRTDGSVVLTDTNMPPNFYDPHWDQGRAPEGSAFIELFAAGNPNNPMQAQELYDQFNGLKLAMQAPDGSPVWRLAITQGRVYTQTNGGGQVSMTSNDVARRLQERPSTCSLDPQDPGFSILPWVNANATATDHVVIERVVTFCSTGQLSSTSAATYGLNLTLTGTFTSTAGIDVFMANVAAASTTAVQPGEYIVVGPQRGGGSGFGDVTTVGRTSIHGLVSDAAGKFTVTTATPGSLTSPGSQPQAVMSLNNGFFAATGVNGSLDYPNHVNLSTLALGTMVQYGTQPSVGYAQIKSPRVIPCYAYNSNGGGMGMLTQTIGLNISEPTIYQRTQSPTLYKPHGTHVVGTFQDEWNSNWQRTDRIQNANDNTTDSNTRFDDIPWDGYPDPTGTVANQIILNPQLPYLHDHTTLRFKSVFLQRLADPLKPWNRYTNPYLTIDWMPFDLTVFNGEPWWVAPSGGGRQPGYDQTAQLQTMNTEHVRDPGNTLVRTTTNPGVGQEDTRVRFGSRQRGSPRWPFKGNFSNMDLWRQPDWLDNSVQGSTLPPLTNQVGNRASPFGAGYHVGIYDYRGAVANQQYFCKWQDPLRHTFGYLNESYHYRLRLNDLYFPATTGFNPNTMFVNFPMCRPLSRTAGSGGNLDQKYGWLMGVDFNNDPTSPYIGAPWRPFNWLTWQNRPFASAMELMLVPAVGPARLLCEYDMRRTSSASAGVNAVAGATSIGPFEATRAANHFVPPLSQNLQPGYLVHPPYGHLLNFFESSAAVPAAWGGPLSSPNVPYTPYPYAMLGSTPLVWPPVSANNNQQTYSAANFFRIFEFVTVPSRFSGLQQVHRHQIYNNSGAASGTEHPGWPFTAPFNYLSVYREPGRVNLNTIPMAPNRATGAQNYVTNGVVPEYGSDEGAIAWRAVTNDFHPIMRWINVPLTNSVHSRAYNRVNRRFSDNAGTTFAPIVKSVFQDGARNMNENLVVYPGVSYPLDYPWNPSQDVATNFYNMFASIHSDSPFHDPRGPNAQPDLTSGAPPLPFVPGQISGRTEDDTYDLPIQNRADPERASLFNNPFRSYMEGYGSVAPAIYTTVGSQAQFGYSGPIMPTETFLSYAPLLSVTGGSPISPGNSFLQVDATLLRRRDTTWSPWESANALVWPTTSAQANNAVSQYDVGFDPLFALNFPRPFFWPLNKALPVTGYTMNLFYRSGNTAAPTASENVFVPGNSTADNYLGRTTDYRNTDRNPFFRYQLYNKLGNVATTRSNVYAIWITVGFFEVERVGPDKNGLYPPYPSQETSSFTSSQDMPVPYRFPGGYRILREVGSETGETVRHKLFAIFDRTIPVGFLRGENLNADQAFLTRRILY